MIRNWMIAGACAIATALGIAGCSGNNAAAPPATPGEPTEPSGPTDPEPDQRTDAEKEFDKALKSATAMLEDALEAVEMAKERAGEAATAEDRAAAREALSDAQDDLAEALEAAQALSAPTGDDLRSGQAMGLVSRAEDAQTAESEEIKRVQASTQWSAGEGVTRVPVPAALPEVRAVRRIRTNAAGDADNEELLDAAHFKAVRYEPGNVLISKGEASTGKLLRMRGYHPVYINNLSRQLFNSDLGRSVNYDRWAEVVAGLRITGDGLVMEIGGRRADGIDFRRSVGLQPSGLTRGAQDTRGWDLTLTFGEPTRSPEGNGEAYWEARLMPDPGQIADGADATTRARFLVDGRPSPVGTYKLWLSNHAGVETNLEPTDPDEAYPEDDVNSFLKYAAYGMMTFQASDRSPYDWQRNDRAHGFHLGYDAFEDEDNKRATDIGEAVSNGKFAGLTIALELDRVARGALNALTAIDLRTAKRLRGDVELTATISDTASDNNIEGRIRNLEVWDSRGYWKDYATIPDDIALGSASIDAKGEYRGTITGVTGFAAGQYYGNFYGPVSGLEVAGAWMLNGTNSGADAVERAIVGSFGAKHVPPSE